MLDMFKMAGDIAKPSFDQDLRTFWLGAVAVRSDQTVVRSKNGSARPNKKESDNDLFKVSPAAHAEHRCLRKAGFGATVYVTRISRLTGEFAISRPCVHCMNKMRAAKVKTCYYTIDKNRYGIIKFVNGEISEERIQEF